MWKNKIEDITLDWQGFEFLTCGIWWQDPGQ